MKKNDIIMIHGKNYKDMTKEILKAAAVSEQIGPDKNKKIGLKPNLVVAATPDTGATTHMEIVEGTIEYLQENGFKNIYITEGSWVGEYTEDAFRICGYPNVARKYHVELVDTQQDSYTEYNCAGVKLAICDFPMSLDFLISLPIIKGHGQTLMTCALKNNKGLIPNREKRHFHTMGLHKPIAHLATVLKPDFYLVDNICGDLDFEEGGNPVTMNRILGFRDPVLCDTFAAACMGFTPDDIPYIRMAEALGVGSTDLDSANIIKLNESTNGTGKMRMTGRVQALAKYAEPKDACSACYASLIFALDRLNDEGLTRRIKQKIAVGQGYKGLTDNSGCIGAGNCTRGFSKFCPGCPPKAVDLAEFLRENI